MWKQRSARALARALQAGFALSAERPPASTWDPRAPWLRCCAGFALGGAPTCTPAEQSRAWMPHAWSSSADSPASVQLCQQRSLSALSRHRLKAAQQRARELAQGQSFHKLPAYLCLCVLFLRTVVGMKSVYRKGADTQLLGSDFNLYEARRAARTQQAAVKPVEGAAHVETASDRDTVPEASPAEAQTAVTPSEGPASPAQVRHGAELSACCSRYFSLCINVYCDRCPGCGICEAPGAYRHAQHRVVSH